MMYKKLISYAQDFVSFLLFNIKEELLKEIDGIILFGSVSRGEAGKDSDIDLFIKTNSEEKSLEKSVDKIMDKFFESPKYTKYWKLLGINNSISCKFGNPSDWTDIYPSLVRDGIFLYGKYRSCDLPESHFILFSWENVKPESKRVTLSRKLYGYRKSNKKYSGLLSNYNGIKISKGSIMIPLEYRLIFENLFHTSGIPVKVFPL